MRVLQRLFAGLPSPYTAALVAGSGAALSAGREITSTTTAQQHPQTPQLLQVHQVQQHLKQVPQWKVCEGGKAIRREFQFRDFVEAWGFLSSVALLSEAAAHHPEIFSCYSRVSLQLTTHDAGGLTLKDFRLAASVNSIVPTSPRNTVSQ
ncbi:pterin-4a-carbinolamine dehydratase [Cyclospora cayetanensis]|uniref:4a-hydroxytetrahydrobiopterin dehydratase n=1 Tax=Cyclospora cayetanensis TaxID=88456 RepID=A0A1D3D369_9EIME|nr:pterin-4a-carbinolamine dehydratase [Cyclospora cayetanensis]